MSNQPAESPSGLRPTAVREIANEPVIMPAPLELRVKAPADGSVLLSIRSNVVLKLNSVGTIIWEILEGNRESDRIGLPVSTILDSLVLRLEQCLSEPVPLRMVRHDLEELLRTLAQKGLVRVTSDAGGHSLYKVAEGISWSARNRRAKREDRASDCGRSSPMAAAAGLSRAPRAPQAGVPGNYLTLCALLGLIGYDLLLKMGGFSRIYSTVKRWPVAGSEIRGGKDTREICARVVSAVNRAQAFYFKKALCLQRSAVFTCLLRRYGVAAEMIIAAHLMPFDSHAWVEVGREVVTDNPDVQRYYDHVIERLEVER